MTRTNSNLSSSSINNQSDTPFNDIDPNQNYDQDHHITDQGEESGWTSYFDDFFSNKTPDHPSSSKHLHDNMVYDDDDEDGTYYNSSYVSDAASCAAWRCKSLYKNCEERSSRIIRADHAVLAACSSFDGTQMVIHKKLRFKNKSTIRHKMSSDSYYDDSLEDTASSPVNSPKAKGGIYGYDDDDDQRGQEKNGLKHQQVVVEVEVNNKSLKEKGLCLVPYSMLLNYIG